MTNWTGASSALQCHECMGKKEDIKNPRLYKEWQDFRVFYKGAASTVGTLGTDFNIKSDSICSEKEDLGQISTCPNSYNQCAYIEFKDEQIKETGGKLLRPKT